MQSNMQGTNLRRPVHRRQVEECAELRCTDASHCLQGNLPALSRRQVYSVIKIPQQCLGVMQDSQENAVPSEKTVPNQNTHTIRGVTRQPASLHRYMSQSEGTPVIHVTVKTLLKLGRLQPISGGE